MDIQTVADNLRNTIAGKEQYLLAIQKERTFVGLRDGEDIALRTTAQFLSINIDELKRILQNVEQCVDQFEKLKKENSDMGWELNPDRMGQ